MKLSPTTARARVLTGAPVAIDLFQLAIDCVVDSDQLQLRKEVGYKKATVNPNPNKRGPSVANTALQPLVDNHAI